MPQGIRIGWIFDEKIRAEGACTSAYHANKGCRRATLLRFGARLMDRLSLPFSSLLLPSQFRHGSSIMREHSTNNPRASSLRLAAKAAGIYRSRLFQIMDGRRRGEGGGGITCSSEAIAAGGGGGEERMEGYANRAQLSQGSRARKRKGGRPISDEREAEVEAGDPRERTEKASIQSTLWTDLLLLFARPSTRPVSDMHAFARNNKDSPPLSLPPSPIFLPVLLIFGRK